VLLLAIIAVGAYLLWPKLRQGGQETTAPTAPLAHVSETVVITVLPGVGTAIATTQPATSTQALSAQEMGDLLAQAKGLAVESKFEPQWPFTRIWHGGCPTIQGHKSVGRGSRSWIMTPNRLRSTLRKLLT